MKFISLLTTLIFSLAQYASATSAAPDTFQNPILPGFNPDPSICRVGDDYYLATSSFTWFPGMPVYHSKDLVNWKLIGHGITRPGQINFNGIADDQGIWAVTIRYHDGLFYLITTGSKCGGNFYITAKDPAGPWSDPVWLKDAEGIDPSLFWDEDGKCYYTGNKWGFENGHPGMCGIWMQELDLEQGKLIGEKMILHYGHANNAQYTEAPHIYKIDGKYLLITAEGGASSNHSVTVHHSDNLKGPYVSDLVNPVLTHRHMGRTAAIQNVGHADLVQTPEGDWWSVVLGTRLIEGREMLCRETFLCEVSFENATPIFNPGYGHVLAEQPRPQLPWSPLPPKPTRDDFDSPGLDLDWYTNGTPADEPFYQLHHGKLSLSLKPTTVDDAEHASLLMRRIQHHNWVASTKLHFQPTTDNEQAGLILYRSQNSYYQLLKTTSGLQLIRKFQGKKDTVVSVPWESDEIILSAKAEGLKLQFYYGATEQNLAPIGPEQHINVLCEGNGNRFNGPGAGLFASGNGMHSDSDARFEWFEYSRP